MDRQAIETIAVLGDEVRAALYSYVREAGGPVTREAAANAVGISRKLAAFHLDKLVDAGLLQARIEAVGVRRVGRTPKVYAPAPAAISVTVPPRSPDLLAGILLAAVASEQPGQTARQTALQVAYDRGAAAGAAERDRVRPGRLGPERALTVCAALLERQGYEPHRTQASIQLRNCPFHPHAETERDLVCGLNHALLSGVLDGLQAAPAVTAALAPRPDRCCVELRT